MAQFNFSSAAPATGFPSVTATGTGITAPLDAEWSLSDGGSPNGDSVIVDILATQSAGTLETNHEIWEYEVAIGEDGGSSPSIEQVLYGPAIGKDRYFQGSATNNKQVHIRSVQRLRNQIYYVDRPYKAVPGDPVSWDGGTAEVAFRDGNFIVLTNISGTDIVAEQLVTINGNTRGTGSRSHPTHFDAYKVETRSEWSNPKTQLSSVGSPAVTLTASKTTVVPGQTVMIETEVSGFQAKRPYHELDFHLFTEKAGEQGTISAVDRTPGFEAIFGTDMLSRASNYGPIWAFAPHTEGTVTIKSEVRDRNGNSKLDQTLDLTVQPYTTAYSDSQVYAVSDSARGVPGFPSANVYSTLTALNAALPGSGTVLVLFDTTGSHGGTLGATYGYTGYDHIGFTCYSDLGIGPAAEARAELNFCISTDAPLSYIHGINTQGPFDPTDPFSPIGFTLNEAWNPRNIPAGGHTSLDCCDQIGHYKGINPPNFDTTLAVSDSYIYEYFDYAVHEGDVGKQAFTGCFWATNPQSWRNAGKGVDDDNDTDGYFVNHTNYRGSRPRGARGFTKMWLFACCSWGGATGGTQPAIRLFGDANKPFPDLISLSQCYLEAGVNFSVGSSSADADNASTPTETIVQGCVIISAQQPESIVNIACGGTTIRSCLLIAQENGARAGVGRIRDAVNLKTIAAQPIPSLYGNDSNPVWLESNTFLDLRKNIITNVNSTSFLSNDGTSGFETSAITQDNNLVYAPYLPGSSAAESTDLDPMDLTARWEPHYDGEYAWDADNPTVAQQAPDRRWQTPLEAGAIGMPKSAASAAWQAATDGAIRDLRGNLRPSGTATLGAFEPDDQPYFTVLPTMDEIGYVDGDVITVTDGTAPGSTITKTTFTIGGVTKTLTGQTFDTTGETPGEIVFETTATNANGAITSGKVRAHLAAARPAITGLTLGGLTTDNTRPLTITATDADPDDVVYVMALLDGAATPTATEVYYSLLSGGVLPVALTKEKWQLVAQAEITFGNNLNNSYRLYGVIGKQHSVLSAVFQSSAYAVNTT